MMKTTWMTIFLAIGSSVCSVRAAVVYDAARMLLKVAVVTPAQLESAGNADGCLTWQMGGLKEDQSARVVVLFAFESSYEKLCALVEASRRGLAELPARPSIGPDGSASNTSAGPAVWIKNAATDFAMDGAGCFFWEGARQSLVSDRGGQLSRLGYYVHYDDGTQKRAGTPITQRGSLENLTVAEPMHAISQTQAAGILKTSDNRIRIDLRAVMGTGPVAAMEFVLTNMGNGPLNNVRLTVYANLESAHDHGNDYGVLDAETGGLLVVDRPTGTCVVMAGLRPPATGYSGRWPSQGPFQSGEGVDFSKWNRFTKISLALTKRLAKASIPHPPAAYEEVQEPQTRTLTAAEAVAMSEEDWLFQADGQPTRARCFQEIDWTRKLANRFTRNPKTANLDGDLDELSTLAQQLESVKTTDEAAIKRLYLAIRRVKRRVVFKNPVVDFSSVLFIDNPYPQGAEWAHQARHRNGMMAVPGGRLLVLDSLNPGGQIRKLAPDRLGSFWKPDLSFDAEQVLFCYKAHDEKSFHLYEMNLDGSGLRQLTTGDYDDLDPIYLPDGHIVFTTTRCNAYVRCMPYTYTYVLARCDADGKNVYIISRGSEPDWCPTLLADGRVIYSRWEYTDKALWRIQSLWTTNQDGTNTSVFWGNQSVWPDHLAEPRSIPGSPRVMFTGLAHHNWFAGSIGIIDPRKGFNFPDGLTKVTCDVAWPECGEPPSDPHESPDYHKSGNYTAYKTPYPLSEEDFLVSAKVGGKFALYLMDVYGNRELIYKGAHNIWHAMPIKSRKRPPMHVDRVAWPGTGSERRPVQPGTFFNPDIYDGVPDLPRGSVKYLRVLQLDAKTASSWKRDARFSGPAVSILQEDGVKRILGVVPVEADGSVHFKVPAGRALHFQVLDEHYRALQTMRSFSGIMPGEVRGCIGCHETHSTAPPTARGLAFRRAPSELQPPPWGTTSVSYERFAQPVLDKYCGECHQGDGEARKDLDLTLRPGHGAFKEPYLSLVGAARYSPVPANKLNSAHAGIAGAIMCENYEQSDPKSYVTFRPMQHLSYKSKLVDYAMSGEHYDVKADPVSLRRLIAWVDANCPYRGEEDIRNIDDPQFAGIDLLPIRPQCKTAPTIERP